MRKDPNEGDSKRESYNHLITELVEFPMVTFKLFLSNNDASINLEVGKPIGITPTATNERAKGKSVIRFQLQGDIVKRTNPFDQLSDWYSSESKLTLKGEDIGTIEECLLRECNLDLSQSRLYVSIYTPFPAQQVRHWFTE